MDKFNLSPQIGCYSGIKSKQTDADKTADNENLQNPEGKDKSVLEKELIALKSEKEAWIDVIKKCKDELTAAGKEMNEKLTEIYDAKSEFCNEVNEFDEQYGILSHWWSTQIISLNDPLIGQNAQQRQNKMKANCEVLREVEKVREEISELETDITNVKSDMVEDGESLLQIVKAEDEIKLKPFGPEFQSLRTDVLNNKMMCKKLEFLFKEKNPETSAKTIEDQFKESDNILYSELMDVQRDLGNEASKDEETIFPQGHSFGTETDFGKDGTQGTPRECQVFQMYEKTTFVYKKPRNSNSSRRNQDYKARPGRSKHSNLPEEGG